MSSVLDRPTTKPGGDAVARAPGASSRPAPGGLARARTPSVPASNAAAARRDLALTAAVAVLMMAACLPLTRVFLGRSFLATVFAAALCALAVDWGCRRLATGSVTALAATTLGWALFVGLAFFPETLTAGIVPTPDTARAAADLWSVGLDLVHQRPAPTFVEPGLLFLAVNGVWAVAHAVDGLVHRLASPVSGVVMALVLFVVPLALAPPGGTPWRWAAPFLVAAAALLIAAAGSDLARFGCWIDPARPDLASRGLPALERNPLVRSGALLAAVAVVAGSVLADSVPGFTSPPWYELRGVGGTTLTSNPIVGINQRLVASDAGPVLRVTSPQPLYTRVTSLDVYGEREEWTNTGISGADVLGPVPPSEPIDTYRQVRVGLEVQHLPDGVLVPMPYQAVKVAGPLAPQLRYDQRLATFTLDDGRTLATGDAYEAVAAVPTPTPAELDAAAVRLDPATLATYTQLPANVPEEVGALAQQLVGAAGATTQFQQALAIQDHLRTWEYSTDVTPGHSGSAMASFLRSRTGYCEQYAGTMAVMLRTLGIPARVAVGFTPGTPVPTAPGEELIEPETLQPQAAQTYEVTLENAHAWVEVLFPGLGWIAFEPTPRTDGNVLVPTATNLAPAATEAQVAVTEAAASGPNADENDVGSPGQPLIPQSDAPTGPEAGALPTAPASGSGGPGRLVLGLALALVGVGAVVAVGARRSGAGSELAAPERVLAARRRVGRLGAGLGAPARPWETDGEYLDRLLGVGATRGARIDDDARRSGAVLARRAEQARWSPSVPEAAATDAEAAAMSVRRALLDGLSGPARATAHARAALAPLRDRARERPLSALTATAGRLRRRAPLGALTAQRAQACGSPSRPRRASR